MDFLVIGGQKCGTTTLFETLRRHPDIFIPREKEAPFFNVDALYAGGWSAFAKEVFRDAPCDKLWATVTPHYMADVRSAERIRKVMPKTKLIATLRNPIDRALSHYRMIARRGWESRKFGAAVKELLDSRHAREARFLGVEDDERPCYLVWGEYGRILSEFRRWFPREQMHVMFLEEYSVRTAESLRGLMSFIGVDPERARAGVGHHYRGGERERWPSLGRLVRSALGKRVMTRLSARSKGLLLGWIDRHNVLPSRAPVLDRELRARLVEYFTADVGALEDLLGRTVPWKEWA